MDNKVITDFEIGVNHLDVWSYQFNERYKFSEKSGRLSVARKNPKSFKVEIDNNELNLFCYFQDTAARSTVKHKVFFATFWVSCGTPMSLNEARNFAYKLLSFMRFTLRKYVMFDSLRVKAVSYNTQQDLSLSSTHFGLIQPIISDVEFDRFSIIFNINHIMKRFPQIMRLWLSMDSIMEHVIESLIESLYRKDQYFAISNFINLVSALDSFSSDRYGDKAKMEDRLNSVTKNLPQQWLNILDEKNTLVSDILKYRHGYVHYKKGRLRGSFNETYQIIDLNWQVERLLICLILRFLGFNDKEIVHYLEYGRISDTFL